MCGYYLRYQKDGSIVKKQILTRMIEELKHRGPDGAAVFVSTEDSFGMAHTRLAINDLSSAADQPFISECSNYYLVFNGEIYNFQELRQQLIDVGYKFLTNCDTEVVLYSYVHFGSDCLQKFEGQYSFCIFDKLAQRFFLARDPSGEKPLYFVCSDTVFAAASEIRCFLADGMADSIEKHSLNEYLFFGYVPKERTLLQGVFSLTAGSSAVFEIGDESPKIFRRPKGLNRKISKRNDKNQTEQKLEDLLRSAVKLNLQADAPVGILLSGGVDSSLITALAAAEQRSIRTFTVKFDDHDAIDESFQARRISTYFETDHREIEAGSMDAILFEEILASIDEPFIDSSYFAVYMICRAIQSEVKVVLGGDGADELFGGYEHYQRLAVVEMLRKLIPKQFMQPLCEMLNRHCLDERIVKWSRFLIDSEGVPFPAQMFTREQRRHILPSELFSDIPENTVSRGLDLSKSLVENCMLQDYANYLPKDILTKSDKGGMQWGVEIRAPFLNRDVIDFAKYELDLNEKVSVFKRKKILRKIAKNILSDNYDTGYKKGFRVPIAEWLMNREINEFCLSMFDRNDAIVPIDKVRDLFNGLKNGPGSAERIYGLVQLQNWITRHSLIVR